ncbi:hypothetical protein DFJ73DRAFT_667122 [Zopfochytrium polystomum]|nr:hypothetical protein DFJ73DRAFT_667122 [Zopfochytrium polystomum]
MAQAPRYSTSRQKACIPCVAAKAKCDRTPEACGRCVRRGLWCAYRQDGDRPMSRGRQQHRRRSDSTVSLRSAADAAGSPQRGGSDPPAAAPQPEWAATVAAGLHHEPLDFSNLEPELTCPINASEITFRWLHTIVPLPGQVAKVYAPPIVTFIHRTLRSYADRAIRGRIPPPFIHHTQLVPDAVPGASSALAACLNVVHMCEAATSPQSAPELYRIVLREMDALFLQCSAPATNPATLVAAFQSALLYHLVLFFRLSSSSASDPSLPQSMVSLQELACAAATRGLVCTAELACARPARWEAWIVAEALRRSLFVMYLLDSAVAASRGLPTFFASELRGVPAPAAGSLWRAASRAEWVARYNAVVADWSGIDELWPMPQDLTEAEVERRRARVALWVEDLDELGTMMYAITSCSHGS